jgi:putative ABC transport system substrate-binding protein
MFNPDTAPVSAYMPAFETAARSLKVIAPVHNNLEIETAITALGREPGGGLLGIPDVFVNAHRAPIISAAARNKRTRGLLPISLCQRWRLVLIRARPGRHLSSCRDLCRSHSTRREAGRTSHSVSAKFEMVVNLKTAKAFGLTVPQSILLTADEVIE